MHVLSIQCSQIKPCTIIHTHRYMFTVSQCSHTLYLYIASQVQCSQHSYKLYCSVSWFYNVHDVHIALILATTTVWYLHAQCLLYLLRHTYMFTVFTMFTMLILCILYVYMQPSSYMFTAFTMFTTLTHVAIQPSSYMFRVFTMFTTLTHIYSLANTCSQCSPLNVHNAHFQVFYV